MSLSPATANANPQEALGNDEREKSKPMSPSVRGSPIAPSDDTDSPRNRCSSHPLGVEHLRERTGRAALMFRDIQSPARSQLLPPSPSCRLQQAEAAAEEDDVEDELVEIVVPALPDDVRQVNVLLGDGSQVEVEVPSEVPEGERYVVNVAEELRRQRRQTFLQEDATRAELLQEIEFLSWSLTATAACVQIQAFVRRRQHALAMKQNAAALMALIREGRGAQTS